METTLDMHVAVTEDEMKAPEKLTFKKWFKSLFHKPKCLIKETKEDDEETDAVKEFGSTNEILAP